MKSDCCTPLRVAGPGPEDDRLAELAKALGHPARVAIMRYLHAQGDCICGDIVNALPLAQSTISQHLKVLREAGLVRGDEEGRKVCYVANREIVLELKDLLSKL